MFRYMAGRKQAGRRIRSSATAWLVCLTVAAALSTTPARAALIDVEVLDFLSGVPLPGLGVVAKQRVGSDYLWAARKDTDANGRATFDLPGLGTGAAYVFVTTPYNCGPVQSDPVTSPGYFAFAVGRLRATLVAGGTLAPLANSNVILKERLPDNSLVGRVWTATDVDGVVACDPPGLGAGRTYALEANSPWDGLARVSRDINSTGAMTFVVGNAPLHALVVDGISGAPISGLSVIANERLSDGSVRTAATRTTDAQGQVTFDLPGLGNDRVYFLTTAPFGGRWVTSPDLMTAGDYTFAVGTVAVTAINGATGAPLASTDVAAKRRMPDGSLQWTVSGPTDAQGIVRFDLPGLGQGTVYVLEARSPVDGLIKQSNELTQPGRHTFVVGRAPLQVRLLNALTGAPLAGVAINAHLRLSAQQLQFAAQRTTDASGAAVFDLAGLGEGATYVLSATPYTAGIVYSRDITTAGLFEFRVGAVELSLVNGADGSPLAGWPVNALEKQTDGTLVWTKNGVTDALGVVRFDLPGIGTGTTYRFGAASPADGTTKHSQDISQPGQHLFVVGNAPLRVQLQNAVSNSGVPGIVVTVAERLQSGALSWIGQQAATDAAGRVVFDLAGLGSGKIYVLAARPYNGLWVYSDDLNQAGDYVFRVGSLEIRAINGLNGNPLTNYKVVAKKVLADGTRPWVNAGYTDAAGIVRFSLAEGLRYVVEATSPADGSTKRSTELTTPTAHTFVVGSAPLQVTLVNGLTGAPLPNILITAEEVLASGGTVWAAQRTTDGAGRATFDLNGLGSGRGYRLYARPYGSYIYTETLWQPGSTYFRVGTLPVTLIDADNNVPLANKQINAVERLADGSRVWRATGVTDAAGIVRFDLPGLSDTVSPQPQAIDTPTRAYSFNAVNPFNNGKEYFTPVSYTEGPVAFSIKRAVAQPFDGTAPALTLSAPTNGATVPANGFAVQGTAADNRQVAQVLVSVVDPLLGRSDVIATYDATTQRWNAAIAATMVAAANTASITVTATDAANNRTSTTVSVQVVADLTPPSLSISAPIADASVPSAGFLVNGTATDAFGVASVFATVDDPVLGRTIAAPLQRRSDGTWTLTVLRGQVTEGRTIAITVRATDLTGNQGSVTQSHPVVGVPFLAHHVANRLTFGASPSLLAEIENIGIDAFIEQQLAPTGLDDSAAEALWGPLPPASLAELRRVTLLRAIYSRRQLLEVLTNFWDNHFNTDASKHGIIAYEVNENTLFRQRAFGRFRDLLGASATSPAMLLYLDNASSMLGAPIENYARELLELHTLGVDGGYTQKDVEEVARAFTGWTVSNGSFYFDAARHDGGEKRILGQVLPAGRGREDGEAVLDLLATHPATAKFICTKLTRLLASDAPPTTLINRCVTKFLATDGSVAEAVRIILRSPEFSDPMAFRAKVRTPFELVTWWIRALEGQTDASALADVMRDIGMNLFTNPIPTGWSETGDDWISSNALLQRIKAGSALAHNRVAGTTIDLPGFFVRHGQTTAIEVVTYLLQSLVHSDYGPLELDVALARLNAGSGFAPGAPDAAARLQDLLATVLSYPDAQYQ